MTVHRRMLDARPMESRTKCAEESVPKALWSPPESESLRARAFGRQLSRAFAESGSDRV